MSNTPFTPGATVTRTTSTSTANVALGKPDGARQVRVANISVTAAEIIYIKFGNSAVEAATTDMPIFPGTSQIFTVAEGDTHIAAIAATGTPALRVTSGHGD